MAFPVSYFDSRALHHTFTGSLDAPRIAVLHGPQMSGKTSLAFQYAVTAAQHGESVLFCINQKTLQARVPKPQIPLCDLGDEILALIEFVYVETLDGVCQALSTLGTDNACCDLVPRHIIVEESDLGSAPDTRAASATLACLGNSLDALRLLGNHNVYGMFVTSQFPVPALNIGAFPFAVWPWWVSIAISVSNSGSSEHTVVASQVFHGMEGLQKCSMRFLFSEEAMVVTRPLSWSS